jgi:4-hydroxy-tetrahydrodipicolinate reductase
VTLRVFRGARGGAQGTVDAVLCLASKIKQGSSKKLYNMIEVLQEGNMR